MSENRGVELLDTMPKSYKGNTPLIGVVVIEFNDCFIVRKEEADYISDTAVCSSSTPVIRIDKKTGEIKAMTKEIKHE